MNEEEQARYLADCLRHGCTLPKPVRFRRGPLNDQGEPLDPERKLIAVYPDHTFPLIKNDDGKH